jgi:hypothetical protein
VPSAGRQRCQTPRLIDSHKRACVVDRLQPYAWQRPGEPFLPRSVGYRFGQPTASTARPGRQARHRPPIMNAVDSRRNMTAPIVSMGRRHRSAVEWSRCLRRSVRCAHARRPSPAGRPCHSVVHWCRAMLLDGQPHVHRSVLGVDSDTGRSDGLQPSLRATPPGSTRWRRRISSRCRGRVRSGARPSVWRMMRCDRASRFKAGREARRRAASRPTTAPATWSTIRDTKALSEEAVTA